jgi:hypothetical protein
MGRPLNKRLFGPGQDQIQVHFHNGSDIVKGYIDSQISSTWFRVNDGSGNLYTCQMTGTSWSSLSQGEMAITAKYDSGTSTNFTKLAAHLGTTADNIVQPWSFDPSTTDNYIQMEDGVNNFETPFTGYYQFNLSGAVPRQYLTMAGSADFAPGAPGGGGAGDYTIEWFQNMSRLSTTSDAHPRVFSVGIYSAPGGASIGVSIEDGHFYFWSKGSYIVDFDGEGNGITWVDTWHHVAIVRRGTTVKVYVDGVSRGTPATNTDDISDSTSTFYLAAEQSQLSPPAFYSFFPGRLTMFRWTNSAVYNGNFNAPQGPLAVLPATKLLLKMASQTDALLDATGRHTASVVGSPAWHSYP